jgi:hypothetical protein
MHMAAWVTAPTQRCFETDPATPEQEAAVDWGQITVSLSGVRTHARSRRSCC